MAQVKGAGLVPTMKVREIITRLEADGWVFDRQKGSHRQYRHPVKPGTVTVAGKANVDLPTDTLRSIFRQAGWVWPPKRS